MAGILSLFKSIRHYDVTAASKDALQWSAGPKCHAACASGSSNSNVSAQRMQAILPEYHMHLAVPLLTAMQMQHAADAERAVGCREWRPRCMLRS